MMAKIHQQIQVVLILNVTFVTQGTRTSFPHRSWQKFRPAVPRNLNKEKISLVHIHFIHFT